MADRSPELAAAISRLTVKWAWFAVILYDLLTVVETDEVPTAATDGKKLYVNPAFFNKLSLDERVFVLAHEIMHVILKHCRRMRMYQNRKFGPDLKPWSNMRWNYATDYIINDILHKSGVGKQPHGTLSHPDYGIDHIADEIYPEMPEDEPPEENWDEHMPGDADGPTDAEVQRAVAGATEAARKQGNMPAHLQRVVDSILDPEINWLDAIQIRVLNYARRDEQSFARPNRKRLAITPHLHLPGRVGHSTGHIVMMNDSSGSVSDRELSHFTGGMATLLEQLSPEVLQIGSCDTQVSNFIEVEDPCEIEDYKTTGGGGTHMPAIFDFLAKEDITPDTLVILTDGWTDWGKDPGYPVIWVITDRSRKPDFGDAIYLSIKE